MNEYSTKTIFLNNYSERVLKKTSCVNIVMHMERLNSTGKAKNGCRVRHISVGKDVDATAIKLGGIKKILAQKGRLPFVVPISIKDIIKVYLSLPSSSR